MPLKVFSKRHSEAAKNAYLTAPARQRIWYLFEESDPVFDPSNSGWDLCYEALTDRLMKEHGWTELRSYASRDEWEKVNARNFILKGVPRFVLDATELFCDLLVEHKSSGYRTPPDPIRYQSKLNAIFEDANLPWRMLEGRVLRMDSKWLEEEIHSKAGELLSVRGFEGALAEFQQARSDLSSGDCKGAIHCANLALESTMKGILGIEHAKPGALIRKVIESKIVPDYHEGFLKAFEEQILRSVPTTRNLEKGVGHGQGTGVNEPPNSLAELAVNLTGVLILYLLKRHLELHSSEAGTETVTKKDDDDFPF